jgi:quinol monooxygenase YgiN
MIVIHGTARIKPGARDQAVTAASAASEASEAEEGNVAYRFAFDFRDPDQVHIFEIWESDEALKAHFGTKHFAALGKALAEVLAGNVELTRYDVEKSGPLF